MAPWRTQEMMRFFSLMRVVIIAAVALLSHASTGAIHAGAQGSMATEDSYISELSDLEVAVDGDFIISETELQEYEAGEGEIVYIDSPTALMRVAFFDDADEPEQTVELFNEGFASEMDSFEVLDEGFDLDRVWSFAQSALDNEEYLLYLDVTPDVVGNVDLMVMIAGPAETFFEDLEAAQQDVTVDDEGVLIDVDVVDLEDMLAEGAAVDNAAEEDPTAEADGETAAEEGEGNSAATQDEDESAIAESDDDRRIGARLPENDRTGEADELENETETGNAGEQTGGAGLEDAGLVSDTEYVSPQFDVPVEWGDRWFVDYGDEESVITDPASGIDSLLLVWGGDDFALLFVDLSAAEGLTPADFAEYWVSEEYLEQNADPDAEILLDDSARASGAVLMRDYLSEGEEVIILKEAVLLNDGETLAVVTLIAAPTMYGEIYGDAEGDVEVGEEPAVSVFSQRQIERALDQ